MKNLVRNIEAIGNGKYGRTVDTDTRFEEIHQLSAAYNEMSREISERNRSLDRMMKNLQLKNKKLGDEIQLRIKFENDLAAGREKKRAILDACIDNILLIDRNFKIIWINAAATKQFRKSREDLIGKSCYQAIFSKKTPCQD